MTKVFRAACLQVTPGNDLDANLGIIEGLVAAAVNEGAQFVAIPEFATYLDRDSRSMRSSATPETSSIALPRLRDMARRHDIWLIVGSLVILPEDDPLEKLVNRSFLINSQGDIAARYDKIHLFDALLSDGRSVGESRHYKSGCEAPVVETAVGRIGLSVCYDLRFPHLYRAMALAGAEILSIPSAFTAETGEAHWQPLLQARAIENGCFVLAPATCGTHPGNWKTYGHSAILDPWGNLLAICDQEPGTFCMAEIDVSLCQDVRRRIPSLTTNPNFKVVTHGLSEA